MVQCRVVISSFEDGLDASHVWWWCGIVAVGSADVKRRENSRSHEGEPAQG